MRRQNDVPDIHSDPHMDPGYESAEEEPDDKRRGFHCGLMFEFIFKSSILFFFFGIRSNTIY